MGRSQATRLSAREASWLQPYDGLPVRRSGRRCGLAGGEGRTLSVGGNDNFVSVTFPGDQEDPRDALYVVAHEVVGTVATAAVRDNTSAADERSGDTGKWSTLAALAASARGRSAALLGQRPDVDGSDAGSASQSDS